jgi:hypothetical protein
MADTKGYSTEKKAQTSPKKHQRERPKEKIRSLRKKGG